MCEHPKHWAHCRCGYKIQPHSDHAIAKDKEQRYNEAVLAIKDKYKNATYNPAYNAQLEREALNNLKRNFK